MYQQNGEPRIASYPYRILSTIPDSLTGWSNDWNATIMNIGVVALSRHERHYRDQAVIPL